MSGNTRRSSRVPMAPDTSGVSNPPNPALNPGEYDLKRVVVTRDRARKAIYFSASRSLR